MSNLSKDNRLELLQWNYEQCQAGYHSRDQMTNDIFYKMVQCTIFYLGLLSLSFLPRTQRSGIVLELFLILLLIAGSLSLYVLLVILTSTLNCKIALRKQCIFIEEKINNSYIKEIIAQRKGRECSHYEDGNVHGDDHCFNKEHMKNNCKEQTPHNLDKKFYLHWECVCKRGGSKKETDEEYPLVMYAGRFLLILWVLAVIIAFISVIVSGSVAIYPDENLPNLTVFILLDSSF